MFGLQDDPTDPIPTKELQNLFHDISELHKISLSPDPEAKLSKGQ